MSKGFNTNWNWKEPSAYKRPKKKISTRGARRKARKEKAEAKKQEMEQARSDLKNHFSLQRYPTDLGICLCIHNEHGLDMPENERQAKRMILSYWKRINGQFRSRRYNEVTSEDFYKSKKWKEVRYIALQQSGGKCCLCGAMARDGVQLHVDHIRPRSLFPEQAYRLSNLQVMCSDCNLGKSNYDDTDWKQHWESI